MEPILRSTILLGLLALLSCNSSNKLENQPSIELNFTPLKATRFVIPAAGTAVIKNEAQWKHLAARFSPLGTHAPPPEVNFDSEMVILSFWGTHSGCSDEVETISSIRLLSSSMEVWVDPLPSLGDCEMLVYPLEMVLTQKTELPIIFKGSAPEIEPLRSQPIDVEGFDTLFVPEPGTHVFKTQNEWLTFWNEFNTSSNPPPLLDFTNERLVAVCYGDGFSGCSNRVSVISAIIETCPILCETNRIQVQVESLPDLGSCRAVIAPIHIVRIPNTSLNVEFIGAVPGL